MVGHQSGQTLAALFLLRTVIEQWGRGTVNTGAAPESPDHEAAETDAAHELLERYLQSLPEDFKSRFTTLRELYRETSHHLHRASGTAELYETTLEGINRHVDARRLFEL